MGRDLGGGVKHEIVVKSLELFSLELLRGLGLESVVVLLDIPLEGEGHSRPLGGSLGLYSDDRLAHLLHLHGQHHQLEVLQHLLLQPGLFLQIPLLFLLILNTGFKHFLKTGLSLSLTGLQLLLNPFNFLVDGLGRRVVKGLRFPADHDVVVEQSRHKLAVHVFIALNLLPRGPVETKASGHFQSLLHPV